MLLDVVEDAGHAEVLGSGDEKGRPRSRERPEDMLERISLRGHFALAISPDAVPRQVASSQAFFLWHITCD